MAITVTFLEQGGQQPAEVAALLAAFFRDARSSLHLAIYDFRLSDALAAPVIEALTDRLAAGVDVRIAYDAGKPFVPFHQASADPAPPGTASFIRRLGSGILAKPITGGDPQLPKLMHHKYVVRDGKSPLGAVWTGSANFTDDSWTYQENNIVRIESAKLCDYFETDFEELWLRSDIATTGQDDTGTVQIEGNRVDVAFAPGQGRSIDHEIAHCIATARRRLKICSMLITSGAILGALSDALALGRVSEFGGLYDATQMESVFEQWQATPAEWKTKAFQHIAGRLVGKRSTPFTPDSRHDFMHNKIVIADDTVITGSYNLSHNATENAENVLFLHNAGLADEYNDYVDRLVKRYGTPAAHPGT
jgi:phosphatidylserine/phosphatidylglycerophosphate/cardiolipin synthase-like enzyme